MVGTEEINAFLWQNMMLPLVLIGGTYLTVKSRGLQFVKLPLVFQSVFASFFSKEKKKEGSVTPFQALSTALAGTVGTGSIIGSCQAVVMGGYGAVFWMIVAAFLGMILKFFEVTLAVHFRRKNQHGEWVGGPMYYILYGMKKGRKPLAASFALFAVLASFGMGNLAQANSISSAAREIAKSLSLPHRNEVAFSLAIGLITAFFLAVFTLGGMGRIGEATQRMIPVMCLVFLLLSAFLLIRHAAFLPTTIARIFRDAFSSEAVLGGGAGISTKLALEWGLKRSAFSNEAGLGSSSVSHAAADTEHPVKQGLFGIFEVFADTVVISVITCLVLLTSLPEEALFHSSLPDTARITAAFATLYGNGFASLFVGVSLILFAFSTLLGWSFTGRRCFEFLFGEKSTGIYLLSSLLFILAGALMPVKTVWLLTDVFNSLMVLTNAPALILLSGETKKFIPKKRKLSF